MSTKPNPGWASGASQSQRPAKNDLQHGTPAPAAVSTEAASEPLAIETAPPLTGRAAVAEGGGLQGGGVNSVKTPQSNSTEPRAVLGAHLFAPYTESELPATSPTAA